MKQSPGVTPPFRRSYAQDPGKGKARTRGVGLFDDPSAEIVNEDTGDAADDAYTIVYGSERLVGRQQEEIERLQHELDEARADRRRAREEAATGSGPFRKRPRTDNPIGPPIDRAEIEAVRQMIARETEYQSRLHSNPFVKYAVAAAEYANTGNSYSYVNNVYTNMLDILYGGSKKASTASAQAAATQALRVMGETLRAFPADAAGLANGSIPQEAFFRMYGEVAAAVDQMRTRRAYLEELKFAAKPDPGARGQDILSQGFVERSQLVLESALSKAQLPKHNMSLAEIIYDDVGRGLLAKAVAYDIIKTKTSTTPMPVTRAGRKMSVADRDMSHLQLSEYLRRTRAGSFAFSPGFMPVSYSGGSGIPPMRTLYSASGQPVNIGI